LIAVADPQAYAAAAAGAVAVAVHGDLVQMVEMMAGQSVDGLMLLLPRDIECIGPSVTISSDKFDIT